MSMPEKLVPSTQTVHVGSGNLTLPKMAFHSTGTFLAKADDGLPALVVKALIIPGNRTAEGVLIQAVTHPWRTILKIIENDPSAIYEIPPRKWEEIIAGSYHADGFEVTLTPQSGDYGRDVIAVKRGFGCVRFIDQVKAYKPGHLVTAEEVRALIGVLATDQAATKAVLTTTSDFAPKIPEDPSIKPHMPFRLELINGEALRERLAHIGEAEDIHI